jgi:flagellar biosynthesis chaperone FliJ
MIRLGGLVSQKAFGKFEMGKVISNPFANAFIKEAEGEDHEVSMANNSLDTIIKMATELKAKMGENEKDIPAWIQDHITNAENFISQASSNYHEYGQNEARIAEDKGPCWKGYQQIGMKEKDGRQVPNCVPNESVVKEISGRTPKIFVKTAAVEKKIKELMADRKKAVVPYNSETDPAKKEKLKQILIKLTNQIKGYEKNLIQLRDMEELYLQQMHADAELDTTGL